MTITLDIDTATMGQMEIEELKEKIMSYANRLLKRKAKEEEEEVVSAELMAKIEKARRDLKEGRCVAINRSSDIDRIIEERRKCMR